MLDIETIPNFVYYHVDVSEWFLILNQHLGECSSLVGIDTHHVTQQEHIVWREVDLLGIQHDLLELTCLSKALDHLKSNRIKGIP